MPSFSEAVQESGRLALCAVLAGNEAVNALISPVAGDSLGLYPLTSGLRRKVCSDDPANDPVYVPPFTGGQCVGVFYDITWSGTVYQFADCSGPVNTGGTLLSVAGPIQGVRGGLNGPTVPQCAPNNAYFFTSGTGAGSETLLFGQGQGAVLNSFSVARSDAQPDLCGDPPPPPSVPGPITYVGPDITYNIDDSTQITVPISFIFAPAYIDLDGSINIPVTFDAGGIEFNGELEVSPEFNFEFNPSGVGGGPGQVDDPDGIGAPGVPSDPVDIPPEGTLPIVGVLVYSDIDSDAAPSGILFPTGPDIYAPRVASVQFAIQTANSIGWTPDLDVKNLECYVACPAPQGAIAVRVSPMPGVQSRFTAVRGNVLTSFNS